MRLTLPGTVLGALLALLLTAGCQADQPSAAAPSADQPVAAHQAEPYVLHLPGIAGLLPVDESLMRGLRDGGVTGTIVCYDWTAEDRGLRALSDSVRHARQAEVVAQILAEIRRNEPDRPVYLIGHSGGAGIAVWALERLPADVMIRGLILLAPALSPTYDLRPALSHVDGQAYALVSEHDPVLAATRWFGTIDRVNVEAAGRVGFVPPEGVETYDNLVQVPYRREWIKYGHIGDHIGMMTSRFAAAILAPLITGETDAAPELAGSSQDSHDRH